MLRPKHRQLRASAAMRPLLALVVRQQQRDCAIMHASQRHSPQYARVPKE
jgi:hypothetical protein